MVWQHPVQAGRGARYRQDRGQVCAHLLQGRLPAAGLQSGAWSDRLLPAPGGQYRKVLERNVQGVWGQPGRLKVRYLLQSQLPGWPNFTGGQVISPGVASAVQALGGAWSLYFAGFILPTGRRRSGAPTATPISLGSKRPSPQVKRWWRRPTPSSPTGSSPKRCKARPRRFYPRAIVDQPASQQCSTAAKSRGQPRSCRRPDAQVTGGRGQTTAHCLMALGKSLCVLRRDSYDQTLRRARHSCPPPTRSRL